MKPWREIAIPHGDVLKGTFQQSEFAADITAVHSGKAPVEYQDAKAFFERTYITEGMRLLLTQVAQRLSGKGGEPVIQLQTAFGGGKTHTMLAVLHLASRKCPLSDLQGIPSLIEKAGLMDVPQARVAVIDGNAHAPGQAVEARQDDGEDPLGRTRVATRRERGLRPGEGSRRERHLAGQRRASATARRLRPVRRADGRTRRLHPPVRGRGCRSRGGTLRQQPFVRPGADRSRQAGADGGGPGELARVRSRSRQRSRRGCSQGAGEDVRPGAGALEAGRHGRGL